MAGNEFMVGACGDEVRVMAWSKLPHGVTRTQAVNLAAWLVAVAGASREEFLAQLEKVESGE